MSRARAAAGAKRPDRRRPALAAALCSSPPAARGGSGRARHHAGAAPGRLRASTAWCRRPDRHRRAGAGRRGALDVKVGDPSRPARCCCASMPARPNRTPPPATRRCGRRAAEEAPAGNSSASSSCSEELHQPGRAGARRIAVQVDAGPGAAQLAQAGAARTQRGFYVVRAPYAGVVAEVPVALGDMAMPGRPLADPVRPGGAARHRRGAADRARRGWALDGRCADRVARPAAAPALVHVGAGARCCRPSMRQRTRCSCALDLPAGADRRRARACSRASGCRFGAPRRRAAPLRSARGRSCAAPR